VQEDHRLLIIIVRFTLLRSIGEEEINQTNDSELLIKRTSYNDEDPQFRLSAAVIVVSFCFDSSNRSVFSTTATLCNRSKGEGQCISSCFPDDDPNERAIFFALSRSAPTKPIFSKRFPGSIALVCFCANTDKKKYIFKAAKIF
jgi:hypothetical protein